MTRPKRILALFGPFDETTQLAHPAISLASQKWQSGFLRGLCTQGAEVSVMTHVLEPLWPRGQKVWVSRRAGRLASGLSGSILSYANLPGIRTLSLRRAYYSSLIQLAKDPKRRPDLVVAYNVYPWSTWVGRQAIRMGVPFVVVYADIQSKTPAEDVHYLDLERASGVAFLSYETYSQWGATTKMHLDGGVDAIQFEPGFHNAGCDAGIRGILYAGGLRPSGGINLLAEAFSRLQLPNIELWVCGPGRSEVVESAARRDPRITVHGVLPEARLKKLLRQASVCVNPRLCQNARNNHNFPSKILEYLSHGKPVVSTWTGGLSPDYRDVLTVVDRDCADALAAGISRVLSWTPAERAHFTHQLDHFLRDRKLWSEQAERFLKWTETMNAGSGSS